MVATLYPRSPQPASDIYFKLLGLPRRASCSIWRDRPFRRSCPQARQPNYEGPSLSGQIFHPIHHITAQTRFNQAALHHRFYVGLAPRLKNELACLIYPPHTLSELRVAVLQIDSNYWKCEMERK